jgi:hypothetical protein
MVKRYVVSFSQACAEGSARPVVPPRIDIAEKWGPAFAAGPFSLPACRGCYHPLLAPEKSLADGVHASPGRMAGLQYHAVRRARHQAAVPLPASLVIPKALPAIVAVSRNEKDRARVHLAVARRLIRERFAGRLGRRPSAKVPPIRALDARITTKSSQSTRICRSSRLSQPPVGLLRIGRMRKPAPRRIGRWGRW